MRKTRKKSTPARIPARVLTDQDERLVSARELLERIPIHRSTLNAMLAANRFPPPLRLTSSKLLWRWSTIVKWLDERERHPLVDRRTFQLKKKPERASASP